MERDGRHIEPVSQKAGLETVYLRLALAAGFITAVTDRFGLWGPYGVPNVAWGDMHHFTTYAGKLNPWFPGFMIPALAWIVTMAESTLVITLLLGWKTRLSATLAGCLLLAFAIGMTAGTGIKSALNASVFTASAGAFLLARARFFPLSIDSGFRS